MLPTRTASAPCLPSVATLIKQIRVLVVVSTNCRLNVRIYWKLSEPYKTHQEATSDHQTEVRCFLRTESNLIQERGETQVIATTSLLLSPMELINQPLVTHVVILTSTRSSLTRTQVKVVALQRAQAEVGLLSRSVHQHNPPLTISR